LSLYEARTSDPRTTFNFHKQYVSFCPVRRSKCVRQECVPASQQLDCCWWSSLAFHSVLNDMFRDVFNSQGN
jgi:hypothetical protein